MATSAVQLTLENLGLLDHGFAKAIVDQALSQAVEDCENRGGDGKPRTVTINVSLSKLKSNIIEATLEAQVKLPIYRVNPTAANVKIDHVQKKSVLMFQPDSPENPDQEAIPFDDESEVK